MTAPEFQMDMQRRLTEAFIRIGPSATITLVPEIEVREAGKGIKKVAGTPRAPQEFKKIWPGGDGLQTGGQDGTHHRFDMILLGRWNCVAEIGDTFVQDGQKYIIHSEHPYNGYERKFGVYSYGRRPSDA